MLASKNKIEFGLDQIELYWYESILSTSYAGGWIFLLAERHSTNKSTLIILYSIALLLKRYKKKLSLFLLRHHSLNQYQKRVHIFSIMH